MIKFLFFYFSKSFIGEIFKSLTKGVRKVQTLYMLYSDKQLTYGLYSLSLMVNVKGFYGDLL